MKQCIQTKVAHDRRSDGVASQCTFSHQMGCSDGQQFVAVQWIASFIAEQQSICVAVVGYS
jgi:hypothetical protein